MSIVLHLYRIQQVDSQIDKAQKRLNDIQVALDDNAELRRAKAKLANAETESANTEHALRQAETETKAQRIKIEQTEAMLYSGSIKNPKEIQDLQKKSVSLKKHLATLEDYQLEAMLAHEDNVDTLNTMQIALDALKARLVQQNSQLAGEQKTLNSEKERLSSERQAILPAIDAASLTLYNKLRKSKYGLAVTDLSNGVCNACGETLTPSLQQKVRSVSEMVFCPSCQRIIYNN